jgi:uncharacterized membrane protein
MDTLMCILVLAFFVAICLAFHVIGVAESQALTTTVHSMLSGIVSSTTPVVDCPASRG